MGNKLFIGNLPYESTEDALQAKLAEFGEVLSVKIITDRATGRSKGFGFVEMSSDEEAQRVIENLNDTEFDGRNIVVREAHPQKPRSNNGGNQGGF